jgi:hypothetical protein
MDPTNETADYHPSTKEGGSFDHDDDCSTMSRVPEELPAVRLVAGRGETVDNSPPVAEGIASKDYRQYGHSRPCNLRNKKSKRGVKRERSASVAVNNNNHKHEPRGIPRFFSRIRPINDKTVDFGEESMTLVFDDMESSESTNTNNTGPGSHSSSELCANESFSSLSSSSSGSIGLLPNRWDLLARTFDADEDAIKTTTEDGFKMESKKIKSVVSQDVFVMEETKLLSCF